MSVWTVLLVMPENPDNTNTAGRPTCVNNHTNVSTDDMCHGHCLRTKFASLGIWLCEGTDDWEERTASFSAQSNKSREMPPR